MFLACAVNESACAVVIFLPVCPATWLMKSARVAHALAVSSAAR